MKGIILEDVGRERFISLCEKVERLSENLQLLLDKKQSEKISPEEAAEELDVTTQTIYNYIKKGIVPASKVGRKLLIKRSDIENALNDVKSLKYKR